jgi:hypothetical protein
MSTAIVDSVELSLTYAGCQEFLFNKAHLWIVLNPSSFPLNQIPSLSVKVNNANASFIFREKNLNVVGLDVTDPFSSKLPRSLPPGGPARFSLSLTSSTLRENTAEWDVIPIVTKKITCSGDFDYYSPRRNDLFYRSASLSQLERAIEMIIVSLLWFWIL